MRNQGRKTINFWQAFAEAPPALIRLYARKRKGKTVEAITAEEIAIVSGIPLSRVQQISSQTDWTGISLAEAQAFCIGADFDPTSARDRNRERSYSRKCIQNRPRFQWLKRHPKFESEFRPLIVLLKNCPPVSSRTSRALVSPTTN